MERGWDECVRFVGEDTVGTEGLSAISAVKAQCLIFMLLALIREVII